MILEVWVAMLLFPFIYPCCLPGCRRVSLRLPVRGWPRRLRVGLGDGRAQPEPGNAQLIDQWLMPNIISDDGTLRINQSLLI